MMRGKGIILLIWTPHFFSHPDPTLLFLHASPSHHLARLPFGTLHFCPQPLFVPPIFFVHSRHYTHTHTSCTHTCTHAHVHTHTTHTTYTHTCMQTLHKHTCAHTTILHTRTHTPHTHYTHACKHTTYTHTCTHTTHTTHTQHTHTCAHTCALETKVLPLRNVTSGLSTHPCCVPVFVRTQKLHFCLTNLFREPGCNGRARAVESVVFKLDQIVHIVSSDLCSPGTS